MAPGGFSPAATFSVATDLYRGCCCRTPNDGFPGALPLDGACESIDSTWTLFEGAFHSLSILCMCCTQACLVLFSRTPSTSKQKKYFSTRSFVAPSFQRFGVRCPRQEALWQGHSGHHRCSHQAGFKICLICDGMWSMQTTCNR